MDLSPLRPVYEQEGPYVTLHLEVGRASEAAVQQRTARATTARHELEHLGVGSELIDELLDRFGEKTHLHGDARRTLVATDRGIVFDEVQGGRSHWPELVERADLPDVSGWLGLADRAIPFVLVVADREGADVSAHRALSQPPVDTETVTGKTFYITKVPEGDWAQKQFQQTAENTWRDNARLVADEVRSMSKRHRPRVVFLAGEVRARAEVTHAFEDGSSLGVPVVEVESGGRAAGASGKALWDEVSTHLTELERAADADVAARLDEARGRGAGAATGMEEVLDALAQAQVDRLVVDLAAVEDRTIRPKDHPGLPLPEPAASGREVPAGRALVAAGALSGAELTLLPHGMSHGGGVAALLRWEA